MSLEHWKVTVRPGGWVHLTDTSSPPGPEAWLQYRVREHPAGRRLNLVTIALVGDQDSNLSGRSLYRVPLDEMEAALTVFAVGPTPDMPVPKQYQLIADDMDELLAYARKELFPAPEDHPEAECVRPPIDALEDHFTEYADLTMVSVFEDLFPVLVATPTQPPVEGDEPPAISEPGRPLTAEFYQEVAAAYRWHVARGSNPGPAIAEQTGRPAKTVQRWILGARKAGALPPGRTGRAG